jgi:hypothetical protein
MLRREGSVRTNVLEEYITTIIRETRIGELGKLAVTNNRSKLQRNTMWVTLRHIPEDGTIYNHHLENLYINRLDSVEDM